MLLKQIGVMLSKLYIRVMHIFFFTVSNFKWIIKKQILHCNRFSEI